MTSRTCRTKHSWLEIHNEGASCPLLFLHGYPLDSTLWSDQIEYFKKTHTVIAIDCRGFGKSSDSAFHDIASSSEYTMASLADDCIEALDNCGVNGSVVVCGLSMGGYVAFEIWRRHRSRVSAMILCDTRAVADTPEGASQRLAIAERVAQEGTEAIVTPMLPKLLAARTRSGSPQVVAQLETMMLRVPPTTIANAQRAMANRFDFSNSLNQIAIPVLLVVGEFDVISSPDEMRSIADRIPNAVFEIVENAGHLPPIENPKRFNQALEEFLAVREKCHEGYVA